MTTLLITIAVAAFVKIKYNPVIKSDHNNLSLTYGSKKRKTINIF